jgi:hypothetical protein
MKNYIGVKIVKAERRRRTEYWVRREISGWLCIMESEGNLEKAYRNWTARISSTQQSK